MIDREIRIRAREAALDAEDPNAHLRLGLALLRTGDLDAARAALLRASELAPRREAPRAALREVLAQVAARDLPTAQGTVAGYATRLLLRSVNDEAPLRTFVAADLKRMRRVILRLRSYVGRTRPEDWERLAVRLGPTRELRHPNVVGTLDFQRVLVEHAFGASPRTHEHHVLVSEFLRDPTLDRLIALGPMEPVRVARILRQVLLACEAAHRRGLIHRLISPKKIHVSAEAQQPDLVRVRDFGLALFLGAHGKGRGLLGSAVLAYAPPEVLVAGPCDARSDLYAAGAIAYAMLGGAPPFRWDSKRERLRSILAETPVPLAAAVRAAISPELEAFVMRLLAREPKLRPASAREAIDELDSLVPV
jgi:hypothetical protein